MDDFRNEDEMDHIYEWLKTMDLENEKLVVDCSSVVDVENRGKKCLLVKLLTPKYYNCEAFETTMRHVWRLVRSLRFYDMGEGLMMVEFELDSDKTRVICNGLWSFDKSLILVKDFLRSQQIKNIIMVDASFWIMVYDLTLVAQNEYTDWLIGNLLGKFEEIDLDNSEVEWREFMCVKVKLDIT